MAQPVTDPKLLALLNAPEPKGDPIHIGAPDGSIVEFPAGTSDDTIRTAMAKAYPRPVTDPALLAQLNAPDESKSALQRIREAIQAPTRALENGVFLGLGDRARAVVDSAVAAPKAAYDYATGNAITPDFSYVTNLKRQQDETAQFAKDHPVASPALNAVGGVIAPVGVVGAAAKGAGLGTKMLLGGGAGAGIGAIGGAAGSKDWTDLPQTAKDAGMGAGIGLLLGGVVPATGAAVGAGYRAAANAFGSKVDGMSRAAGAHLVNAVEADGPAAVRARLSELGPDAMLVDAGPALLGKGQGASLNSDEGRSVLQNALTARNEGTNARIQSDVDRALGPAQDQGALSASDRIRRLREENDARSYPAALDNAPPVQITPVMSDLIDRISQAPAGSPEHKALSAVQTMMTKKVKQPVVDVNGDQVYDGLGMEKWKDVPVSHDDAGILHKVKVAIDNYLEHDQPGLGLQPGALNGQQAALKQVRYNINSALEQQVPGYAAANRASAALAKRVEAVQAGTQYLGNGKTTPNPDRFAFDFAGLEPGEQIAFSKGSRAEIDRILGTKANDLQALRSELQGEGGWNTDKIATVHGIPAANELTDSVNRNLKFRDTHNKIVENSQTAQRQSARDAMKPVPPGEVPLINPNMSVTGLLATGAKKSLSAAYNAVRPDPTRSYGEVARALTEQGAARDARLQSILDAIGNRQSNAATAPAVGRAASIIAAIGGKAYADELRNGPSRSRTQP